MAQSDIRMYRRERPVMTSCPAPRRRATSATAQWCMLVTGPDVLTRARFPSLRATVVPGSRSLFIVAADAQRRASRRAATAGRTAGRRAAAGHAECLLRPPASHNLANKP